MLAGLSSRRYGIGLEPVDTPVETEATATSKSAVSRQFVQATETALTELLVADLSGLDLIALMIDGVHFGEHTCVVALGIDIDGVKHPLSLVEGSTENATLVTKLCVDLRERGLDVTKRILAVLDGSKAPRRAINRRVRPPGASFAANCIMPNLRIMPTGVVKPLVVGVNGLARSAQSERFEPGDEAV